MVDGSYEQSRLGNIWKGEKQNAEASTLAKDKRQKEKKFLEKLRGHFYFLSN